MNNFRLRIRDVLQQADRDPGDQGDAPQPHHGGLQLAPRRQVRRHAEGQGAEEDPAAADLALAAAVAAAGLLQLPAAADGRCAALRARVRVRRVARHQLLRRR